MQITIGAVMLAVPTSAVALATVPPGAPEAPTDTLAAATGQSPLKLNVNPRRVRYDDDVAVAGRVSPADAGQTLVLQLSASRHAGWRSLARTKIRSDGRFRLVAPLRHSGFLRVLDPIADAAGLS